MRVGAFELGLPLGRGAFSRVWEAVHEPSGRKLAVKVMAADRVSPRAVAVFRREIAALAALHHPGILAVHDHGTVTAAEARESDDVLAAGAPWLVTDRAETTLAALPLPEGSEQLLHVLRTLLVALGHAHARGVVHRDLKPENVLVVRRFGRPTTVLGDFGLATSADLTELGVISGTPTFMAPEQFEVDGRDVGPWTDLYALGVLAWGLSTGRPPFLDASDDLRRQHATAPLPPFRPVQPDLPPGFRDWLGALLEKQPRARPANAAIAEAMLDGLEGPAPRRLAVPTTWRPAEATAAPVLHSGLALFGVRDAPVSGRRAERDALWDALRLVAAECRPRLVVLHGASGLGTTRLGRWLCERVAETAVALALRARPTHGGLAGTLRRLYGLEGLDRDAASARLERLGAPRPERVAAAAASEEGTVGAVSAVLRALAADGPVVLHLDDAERDATAGVLVQRLLAARDGPGLPVLVVASIGELAEPWAGLAALDGASALGLGPLREDDVIELLTRHVGLEPALAARVADRCGGNPARALQLVGAWAERDALVRGASGFRLQGRVRLPDDLQRAAEQRVEVFAAVAGPDALVGLRLAAALGRVVEPDLWAAACASLGRTPPEVAVHEALRRGWLAHEGERWRFVDGFLRSVLVEAATPEEHRACASALAAAPSADRRSERRARHLVAAGDRAEALPALLEAAYGAGMDHRGAEGLELLDLAERTLDELGMPPSHRHRGRVLAVRACQLHDAVEARARVLRALLDGDRRWDWFARDPFVLQVSCWYALPADRSGLAEQYRAAVRRVAPGRPFTLRFEGLMHQHRGEHAQALALFEEGLRVARATGDTDAAVALVVDVATAQEGLGRLEEAEANYLVALEQAHAVNVSERVVAELNPLIIRLRRGDHAGAHPGIRALLERADDEADVHVLGVISTYALVSSAHVHDWALFDAAVQRLGDVVSRRPVRAPGLRRMVVEAAEVCAGAGHRERAEQLIRISEVVGAAEG